jgi:hypothetical protein
MLRLSTKNSLKIIVISLIIIGPLLAALQIQFGKRAGIKSNAERQINEASLQLQQFKTISDLSLERPSDMLLVDFVVPLGARQDTLLATMADIARQYGARVTGFNLNTDESQITELQLSLYRSNMESFKTEFVGVSYENLAWLLDDLQNSSRPIKVESWEYDSREAKLKVSGRVMFIESYAGN